MLLWEKPIRSRPLPQRANGLRLSQFVTALFFANEADFLATDSCGKLERLNTKLILAAMGLQHASLHHAEFDSIACLDGCDKSAGHRQWNYQRRYSDRKPVQLLSPPMALTNSHDSDPRIAQSHPLGCRICKGNF